MSTYSVPGRCWRLRTQGHNCNAARHLLVKVCARCHTAGDGAGTFKGKWKKKGSMEEVVLNRILKEEEGLVRWTQVGGKWITFQEMPHAQAWSGTVNPGNHQSWVKLQGRKWDWREEQGPDIEDTCGHPKASKCYSADPGAPLEHRHGHLFLDLPLGDCFPPAELW